MEQPVCAQVRRGALSVPQPSMTAASRFPSNVPRAKKAAFSKEGYFNFVIKPHRTSADWIHPETLCMAQAT